MSYLFYEEWEYPRGNGPLWPNANGFIPIMSMDDGHIQNCINLIRRKNWRKGYLPLFLREQERRKKKREIPTRVEDFL